MNLNSFLAVVLSMAIVGLFALVAFLFLGLPPLLRWYVKSTGERARAVICEDFFIPTRP